MRCKKFTTIISFILAICMNLATVHADNSGDVVTTSFETDYLSMMLSDFDLVPIDTLWDVDFENHTLQGPHSGYVCNADGVVAESSRGDTFQINSWSNNSSFEIAEYEGATISNGKSLKGSVVGKDQVQLNEFRSTISSNFAVFNYDYSTENLVSDEYLGSIRFYNENGATIDAPKIRLGGNGNLWVPHGVGVHKQLAPEQAKEWVNVGIIYDFDTSMYYIYIDGVCAYSTDLSSYNIAKTYKLHIYTTGASDNYRGEYWLDNFKVFEAKSRNSIVDVNDADKSLEITFKNNIDTISPEDIEIKFGQNALTVANVEHISENKIRVSTNQEIFSGVYLDISVKDNELNEEITYRHLTEPKSFDVSGINISMNDGEVMGSATIVNSTGVARKVTMIMALKDENGDIISLSFTPSAEYMENTEVSVSMPVGNAKSAEIFFVDDFDNCRPVKNIKFEMTIE